MVPGCTNCSKKTKGSDISYHRLPNDQHTRRTWLRRVRRENLPKPNSCYVCSAHFTPDCFELSLKEMFGIKCTKALKPGRVPSIFPFSSHKPECVLSHKRPQIKEKIAQVQVIDGNNIYIVGNTTRIYYYSKPSIICFRIYYYSRGEGGGGGEGSLDKFTK